MISSEIPELRLSAPDPDVTVPWYVVFTDHGTDIRKIRSPKWIFWFTRPRFRHLMMIGPTAHGGSVCINMVAQMVGVDWFPFHPHNCALSCSIIGATVLETRARKFTYWRPRGIITCVSLAKAVLGINAWWVITPYQLYRYLHKRGARPIIADKITYPTE